MWLEMLIIPDRLRRIIRRRVIAIFLFYKQDAESWKLFSRNSKPETDEKEVIY